MHCSYFIQIHNVVEKAVHICKNLWISTKSIHLLLHCVRKKVIVLLCFQMSDYEAARQAVFNLITEHEDIDALLLEVSIIRSQIEDAQLDLKLCMV